MPHQTIIGQTNPIAVMFFVAFVISTLRHHLVGGEADADHEGFLCRGQEHHRFPERTRARGRLHERRFVPRHRRSRVHQGL